MSCARQIPKLTKLQKAKDLTDLAILLGCRAQQLSFYIYKKSPENQYKTFQIYKKDGTLRTINAPKTNLKIIQKNIAIELEKLRVFKSCVNGFVEDRDVRRNASFHVRKKHLVNIDLKNFFDHVTFGRIYGMLISSPYKLEPRIAAFIAKACTFQKKLPQGAPSSPILTNLICCKMDQEFQKFAKINRYTYTRYADDITFSTNSNKISNLIEVCNDESGVRISIGDRIRKTVESNGFSIKDEKTRYAGNGCRKEVTGLIVNEKINVKRRYIRQIRAMLHAWRKYGYLNAEKDYLEKFNTDFNEKNFARCIAGKISFVRYIKGGDNDVVQKLIKQFNELLSNTDIELKIKPIRRELSHREKLEAAVYVIECHDEAVQATAFFVKDIGIVTCAHCVSTNPYLYLPSDPLRKINIELVAKCDHTDLAIFRPLDRNFFSEFLTINAEDGDGDISLLGYPKHSFNQPLRMEKGVIIRRFTRSAVKYIEISPRIMNGNSGGPIINKLGQVIGVAKQGINANTIDADAQFLAIDISMIKNLNTPY